MRNRPKAVFGMAVPYWEGDVTNQTKDFFSPYTPPTQLVSLATH